MQQLKIKINKTNFNLSDTEDKYVKIGLFYSEYIIDNKENTLKKYYAIDYWHLSEDKVMKKEYSIRKNIFKEDKGLIFEKVENITSFGTIEKCKEEKYLVKLRRDYIASLSFYQDSTVKVKYLKRKRLYIKIFEILSMATTLFANFRTIVIILNLKKSPRIPYLEIYIMSIYTKMMTN
jgi:hypothetical protein